MAATIVPDMPRDGRVHNPRHLSLPLQGHAMGLNTPLETLETPDLSPGSHGPPPNPPFVFPSRTMSTSTPSTYARTTRRRPRSAIEMPGFAFGATESSNDTRPSGSTALPDFSFNPGASLAPPNTITPSTDNLLSAPRSPHSPRLSARGVHRRGGSEFVGGEYRSGNARMEVLNTSPTGSDNGKVSPQLLPVEPSRRGPAHRHAHRRSAAMSSHDLSTITGLNLPKNSSDVSRGNSAPSSPSVQDLNKHFSFPMIRSDEPTLEPEKASEPKVDTAGQNEAQSPPAPTPEPVFAQRKSFSKGRVGFSDTLEFIPRPLSLVSSDTSSTVTVKPGHSVSGSISSVMSASNSVIMEKDETLSSLEATPSQGGSDSRPSTAGAILEGTQSSQADTSCASPLRRGSFPLLTEITLAAPGSATSPDPSPTRIPKRWSFFGLDHFAGSHSPSRSRPVSLNSCEVAKADLPSSDHVKDDTAPEEEQAVPKAGKKSGKKQRKVKTWAGSILTKKSKGRHGKSKKASRRGPTPPPSRPNDEADEDSASDSADTKSEPMMPTVMITELDQDQTGVDFWKPPRPVTEDDTSYPMIDLDAALGPFNTPLPRNPEWEAAQKAGGLMKRQLHSAAGMSRFSGPGMHYTHHQRAQSSPEMPPFEFRRGANRFGSSSTMADSVGHKDSEASSFSNPFSVRSSAEKMAGEGRSSDPSIGMRRKCSDPEDCKSQRTASMKSRTSLSSLQEQVIDEEPPAIPTQFRKVEFGRPAQRKAPESPISPRAPMDGSSTHTTSSSLAPVSPYSSVTQSSALPSPRSPASYDVNIICTAPSSVTDDSFQSLLMGEPGPEVRKSMDIPSVSSSHSNQARENLFAQQAAQMNRPPAPGERPASFSVMAFGSRRGSLASLSRLISSSHGERSKLSTEVTYNSDSEKKPKGSKSRRFSRMVQFWKPKENGQQS
ncbi:hypothetical protein VP1G_08561 [Cytospora mali]|uniref:Cell wall proline rich protein n=1 Tax=Cytospora mali TaxID=578113 RepID=A0A194VC99_CYTMA|nr:hypothetical protein VP1G_08561 [Valsa mali var. pyri (nom. inval.)]